jgi:hypothetical protein
MDSKDFVTKRAAVLSTVFKAAEAEVAYRLRRRNRAVPLQLAKLFGFLTKGRQHVLKAHSSFDIPFKQEVTNEVSELDGILLVRLGGCSAMQVRLEPDRENVVIRIVPMARATDLHGVAPWQFTTDVQLQNWSQSGSAVWQWLVARGIDSDKVERRLEALPSPVQPQAFFARRLKSPSFRSKPSLSLP